MNAHDGVLEAGQKVVVLNDVHVGLVRSGCHL